jgi:hypothetical protein
VSYEDIELDKIPGAWVLTGWLQDGLTLRLKLIHSDVGDPDHCVAQIRVNVSEEFQTIHEFSIDGFSLDHLDEFPDATDDFPSIWKPEFLAMARMWARLTSITAFGSSVSPRYAYEPESSRDSYL